MGTTGSEGGSVKATDVFIEKDVPRPAARSRKNEWTELLQKMNVGDSFHLNMPSQSVWSKFSVLVKKVGIKISIRVENNGCRVWRIE